MMRKSTWFVAANFVLFVACHQESKEISGFNQVIWKNDKFGCKNQRILIADSLLAAKDQILGLRETEVLKLLGKSDTQEIYSRNQKFLIYYLEPNKECTAPENAIATAKALNVRLNAIGVANEMYISKR